MGAEPAEDAGGEGGGKRAILLVAAHAEDLVHGAAREPAARQGPVDRGDAERQHPMHRRCRPLDPPNPFAKFGMKQSCSFFVLLRLVVNPDLKEQSSAMTLAPLLDARPPSAFTRPR